MIRRVRRFLAGRFRAWSARLEEWAVATEPSWDGDRSGLYNEIIAETLAHYADAVADNVVANNALLRKLKREAQGAIR